MTPLITPTPSAESRAEADEEIATILRWVAENAPIPISDRAYQVLDSITKSRGVQQEEKPSGEHQEIPECYCRRCLDARSHATHKATHPPKQMCVYLAGRYSRREELCAYRTELQALGFTVQARWLNGEHQLANDGTPIGESGEALVEGGLRSGERLSETDVSARAALLRTRFAMDDWEDVNAAELVISFTEAPRSKANRGGRHVEYGIALANKARVIVIGHRENIFHWLPTVEFYETWQECLNRLKDSSVGRASTQGAALITPKSSAPSVQQEDTVRLEETDSGLKEP